MKNQEKYITTIVILVAFIQAFGGWIERLFGKNIASFITSIGTTSLAIYILYYVWNKWLWKIQWLSYLLCKLVGFYEYPVLNGNWSIKYESTFNNGKRGVGDAIIQQSYSSLHIDGSFGTSSSFESFFAQLKQKESGKWFLVYSYRSKPRTLALINSLSGGMHEGFVYLDIFDKNKLEGYYSNDENRKTRGKIVLTRKS